MRNLLLIAVLALGGCGPSTVASFSKTGGTQSQFDSDRYDCIQQATENKGGFSAAQKSVVRKHLFMSCMAAKGYRQSTDGTLRASADSLIQMDE